MHRSIAIIMLIMVSLYAKAQNFQTITRVVFEQGKISGYNSLNKLAVQVHCGDMVWQVLPDNSIKIWDDIHSFTVFSATLSMPAFTALGDSLRAWQVSCGQSSTPFTINLDTTHIDTSLIVPTLIENFSNRNNDTLRAILQEIKKVDSVYVVNRDTAIVKVVGMKDTLYTYDLDTSVVYAIDSTYYTQLDSIITLLKDTIDFEYKSYCYRGKSDSGVYSFNVVFSALTPNTPTFINFTDVDSLYTLFEVDYRTGATIGVFPNIAQDYVPCEKWFEYLSANAVKDTIKALVYTTTAKVRTDRDTLFNCKSISFGRKSGASGTLVLTYENGESENFDVANDDLPAWVNGEFISYIDYNATGAVGLIVNTLGCSQTDTEICAKVKPIFDCELVVPITCNGWQSASGVWQTISGCWNTGQ